MLFVWGTKILEKKIGFVADFCYICREINVFRLLAVNRTSHIYGGAVGKGELLCHKKVCIHCHTKTTANSTIYKDCLKKIDSSSAVDELSKNTFPDIKIHYAERLLLEKTIREDYRKIDSSIRSKLLLEPFEVLSENVESRFKKTNIDKYSGISLVLLIAIPILTSKLLDLLTFDVDLKMDVIISIVALCIANVVFQFIMVPRRYLRDFIYQKLKKSLSILHPSKPEIENIHIKLKALGYGIARYGSIKVLTSILVKEG